MKCTNNLIFLDLFHLNLQNYFLFKSLISSKFVSILKNDFTRDCISI